MMNPSCRNIPCILLASALTAGMLFACGPRNIVAQDVAGPPAPAHFDYTNTDNCLLCHGDAPRMKDHSDFIGVAPAEIWSTLDKHGQSFLLLKDKSRQLTNQILGFDLREAFTGDEMTSLSQDERVAEKVQTVKSCLRCHATRPKDAEDPTGQHRGPVEPLARGVSCQACHGPAGEWVQAHADKWWRRVSHQAKSKLGFTNVRDGVVRTNLCAGCHVGSVAEEKFVKHEWYAAGHPPLPGFEYAAFAAQMPAHWKPLLDKGDFDGRTAASRPIPDGKEERMALRRRNIDIAEADIKANYREANFPLAQDDAPLANLPRTQEVILSGAVVLKTYAGLVGDYAEEAAKGNKNFNWPEFALYDCASCHHELRRKDGLASRPGPSGPPGRPPMPRWTSALLGLATERKAELDGSLRALEVAFTQRPFGDPKQIAAATGKLRPQLQELCQELGRAKFDEERMAKSLSILLGSSTTAETRDYASARQVAWAIQGLRQDMAKMPYGFAPPLDPAQQQAQDRITSLFRRHDQDELCLSLPAGKEKSVVDKLPMFLEAMENYDAAWFAERIKQIKNEQPNGE
jgi:Cytochrome c554 and c-prime